MPPACFLQTWHFILLLGSHPTIQNCLEGETTLRSLSRFQGTQHQECPCHPLPRGSHQARGCQEVLSAPWRGTNERHTAPGWVAAAGEMALCTGTALACSPPAQPSQHSLQSHQPSNPTTPGEKTGEKSASPIAGSGREQERPTLSTPTHRVATAPGWLGTALSVW